MNSETLPAADQSSIRVVVIGGGHGLSSVIRGLKHYTRHLTAVVTVADDGGSSGALRRDIGILPPGDIRSCLAAMADDEELMTQVLQYRFSSADGVGSHNLGNLLLTALVNISGSFEQGIQELARILAIHGSVTPSTLANINLAAEVQTIENDMICTQKVFGESEITEKHGHILRCWIEPDNVSANPEAIRSILNADAIILGPGSLYTSILPNLMVPGISQAIKASGALRFYICNLTSQPGETDNLSALDHVEIIQNYLPEAKINGIICNNFHEAKLSNEITWVKIINGSTCGYRVFESDLVDKAYPWRHDPEKLAKQFFEAYQILRFPEHGGNDMDER